VPLSRVFRLPVEKGGKLYACNTGHLSSKKKKKRERSLMAIVYLITTQPTTSKKKEGEWKPGVGGEGVLVSGFFFHICHRKRRGKKISN